MRAEQAMRMADTALDNLADANGDASSDPVPEVEFNEEEVLRTCSDFIKVSMMQKVQSCVKTSMLSFENRPQYVPLPSPKMLWRNISASHLAGMFLRHSVYGHILCLVKS